MRLPGFTLAAVLIGVTAAWAQPPGSPGVPGAPVAPKGPAGAPAPDPNLDAHLAAWERTMGGLKNFRVELQLKRTDAVFKKDRMYSGAVLCMKPNFARLRLDYRGDP